jgi:methionine-rich copper-binding protein CopC
MHNKRAFFAALALAAPLFLTASTSLHLELVASSPFEDQKLEQSPATIWLRFSAIPDMEQTSFSVRGAQGVVELGEIVVGDAPEIITAELAAPIAAGEYTLSWVGAPADDHPSRGRYVFTVMGR